MNSKFIFLIFLFIAICAGAKNRAVIVGIGDYDTEKTGWGKLHGNADADLLAGVLFKRGFDRNDITILKDDGATKKTVLEALRELADDVKAGDKVIFHFSGHGQPVTDLNGDETNGSDEAIVPFDAFKTPRYKNGDRYYQGENHIIDDELNPIFNEIKRKVGKTGYFLVSIDACYSRGIEMDALGNLTREEQERVADVRGTDHILKVDENSSLMKVARPTDYDKNGNMAVISACREDEKNFEYKNPGTNEVYGSLSYTLYMLFARGSSFKDIVRYFKNKEYEKERIFVSLQHPKTMTY